MARESAFNLPPLPVDATEEAPLHLASVLAGGPLERVALACGDHRGADSQCHSTKDMVVFGVIGCVTENAIESNHIGSVTHRRRELRRVLGGSLAYKCSGQEMRLPMAGHRQLGKGAPLVPFALAPNEIAADMAAFEASGVDDAIGLFVDEPQLASAAEDVSLKNSEGSFFKSRPSAYERVE